MNKSLVGIEESAGAVIRRCSVNKVLRKIVQNSQENEILVQKRRKSISKLFEDDYLVFQRVICTFRCYL